ncbi:hypothetical protein [Sphingobium sp. DN12]|uniref:hypothetical protein n=1 Tax=Sphingobium sp. DN12 TaxID=3378073 RepID=UPI003DA2F547
MLSPENQYSRKSSDVQEQSYDALTAMQADHARVVDNLAKAEIELLRISRLWSEAEAKNINLQNNISNLESKVRNIEDSSKPIYSINDEIKILQKKLDDRHHEIASLTKLLKFSQHQTDEEQKKYEWMREIAMFLIKIPRWWSVLPKKEMDKKKNESLLNSGLFDSEYYINKYPDVGSSNINPLKHYIFHGINENRSIRP